MLFKGLNYLFIESKKVILMTKRWQFFDDKKDMSHYVSSMQKYVKQKQEMDKFLESIISPTIKNKKLKILDACCGIGHISYFLSKISSESTFVGIDQSKYLIANAKKLCKDNNTISFQVKDIFKIGSKYKKHFDVSINWKTISWLPYYDEILQVLFKVTKKKIFLSSLFYDGDIDFEIKVREFNSERGKNEFNAYYNVYSFPRFKKFIYSLGAKKIKSYNFEIEKDLPKPAKGQMGTYTVRLDNGKRMQISGPVVMSWKIIGIDL